MTRRSGLFITVAFATALLVSSCSDASDVDLGGLFAEEEWELAKNPRDVTNATCTGEPRCQQAYETDQALYVKFDSTEDAKKALDSFGSTALQSRAIVVDFKDSTLTKEQRQQIFEVVDGTHRSS